MSNKNQSIELTTVQLPEEKVNEIKELQGQLNNLINQVGQLHFRKKELHTELENTESNLESIEESVQELNSEMRKHLNKLDREYPRGALNLEEGTVTYRQDIKDEMERRNQEAANPNGVEGGQVINAPFK